MGEKEQRDAGNRHDSHGHSDVYQEMKENETDDSRGNQGRKTVFRRRGDVYAPEHQEKKKSEDQKRPKKAPLFRENGKDKVGALLWKVLVVALGSFEKALAEWSPGADGGYRLNNIPTGSPGIDVGVEKDDQPHYLILAENTRGPDCGYKSGAGKGRSVENPVEVSALHQKVSDKGEERDARDAQEHNDGYLRVRDDSNEGKALLVDVGFPGREPRENEGKECQHDYEEHVAKPRAGGEGHKQVDRREDQGRPEVGLREDQHNRNHGDGETGEEDG